MSYTQHKSEESVEDYLETILVLGKEMPEVRSIDIANEMHFSKPSVSVAMKNLKGRGYITVSDDGFIHLTSEGKQLAEAVYERHSLITKWLIKLGVDPEIAAADACKMEHDISPESFEAIKKYIQKTLY
ncbi:MAG: metal-dependent transcriptional regulator [Lachnospiraceae bacterium]|nr:metal-dependent transcriptional regulator [Lachnospiraceae bacterium]